MIDLGLSKAEYNLFLDTLRTDHRIRLDVTLLNKNEEEVDSLTGRVNRVLDGSIQVDCEADVTRSLELTLLDENRKLRFEPDSPAAGAVYADRFVSVSYGVYVPDLGWVWVPVFWGPVIGFSREGSQVSIEAQGKEALMLDPHFALKGFTVKKGRGLDDAVRDVAERTGEERFDLPALSDEKLKKSRSVSAQDQLWHVIKGGAEDADGKEVPAILDQLDGNRKPFYDGEGRLSITSKNKKSIFTFRESKDLLSTISLEYDSLEFRNTVVVSGAVPESEGEGGDEEPEEGEEPADEEPKEPKKQPTGQATLPSKHPLSPEALARNGKPRHLTHFVEVDGLKSNAACEKKAKEILKDVAEQGISASFECLPIPHLEEWDRCEIKTDDWDLEFKIKQFTLPLTASGAMSVGYNKSEDKFERRTGGGGGRNQTPSPGTGPGSNPPPGPTAVTGPGGGKGGGKAPK